MSFYLLQFFQFPFFIGFSALDELIHFSCRNQELPFQVGHWPKFWVTLAALRIIWSEFTLMFLRLIWEQMHRSVQNLFSTIWYDWSTYLGDIFAFGEKDSDKHNIVYEAHPINWIWNVSHLSRQWLGYWMSTLNSMAIHLQ